MKKIFSKIFNGVLSFFRDPRVRARAQEVAQQITDLAELALPIVQSVAALTPTPADDLLIAALRRINKTAAEILSEADEAKRAGMLLWLSSEALRLRLMEMVANGTTIGIGDLKLRVTEQVAGLANSLLHTAAQAAYGLWKNAVK